MQPHDPPTNRPDYQPSERPYDPRPIQSDFTRPPAGPEQPYQPPAAPGPSPAPTAYTVPPSDPQLHDSMKEAVPGSNPPKKEQLRNWLLPVMITIGAAIVVALILLVLVVKGQDQPNTIFKQAFESTLRTHNIEVQTNAGGSIMTTKLQYGGPMGPQLSNNGDLKLNGSNLQLNGYGTLLNTFVQYTDLSSSQITKTDAAALKQWVHLRNEGKLAPGINTNLANFADPRSNLVGDVVFGDFTDAKSAELAGTLISSKVYSYNLSKVRKVISDGQTYLEYPVTLNVTALKAWNQQIITAMGIPASDIKTDLNTLNSQTSATGIIYINKATAQLVRFDLKQGNTTTTTLYSGQNKTSLLAQPSKYLTWAEFAPSQNQLEQRAAQIQSDASTDAERKADLTQINQYIQTYYTGHSNYPTLANLNDQVWVSVNMQGINPDVFKDPQGSSQQLTATPTVNSYAYEPLGPGGAANCNDLPSVKTGIPCESYTLVAILSSGKQLTLTNLD